jgi:hypothetical protein
MTVEDKLSAVIDYGNEYSKKLAVFETPSTAGVSETRAITYRRLMRQAEVQRVDVAEEGEVLISIASWGVANRGWRVSAAWRSRPPKVLLPSLDAFSRTGQGWDVAYTHVVENWYFRIVW